MNKKLLIAAVIAGLSVNAFATPHYDHREHREQYQRREDGRHSEHAREEKRAEQRRFDEARNQPHDEGRDTYKQYQTDPNTRGAYAR
jgi:hypothetical protein